MWCVSYCITYVYSWLFYLLYICHIGCMLYCSVFILINTAYHIYRLSLYVYTAITGLLPSTQLSALATTTHSSTAPTILDTLYTYTIPSILQHPTPLTTLSTLELGVYDGCNSIYNRAIWSIQGSISYIQSLGIYLKCVKCKYSCLLYDSVYYTGSYSFYICCF